MIRNLTGGVIRLYGPDTTDRLDDVDRGLVAVLEPEDTTPRITTLALGCFGDVDHRGRPIPLDLVEHHLEDLPPEEPGTALVVQLVVAVHPQARGRSDLLVPHSLVRTTTGTVIGYRQLARPC